MKHSKDNCDYDFTVQIAYDIIGMKREIDDLKWENKMLEDYKNKYIELLNKNIAGGRKTMAMVLGGLLEIKPKKEL